MLNRITLAMSCIVALVIAASSLTVQPTRAQSTAQGKAQSAADECLGKPIGAPPRGSHWYYRIDRPSGGRCWYLGPADMKVRQAAPVERGAAAISAPPPRELHPAEQSRAETPVTAGTAARLVATTAANSVAATDFSAAWPAVPNATGLSDRDATAAGGADAKDLAATRARQEDTPPVWHALTPADRAAAAQPSESMPGLGHLAIFLAATTAFVAIAFRAMLELSSAWFGRRERRPVLRSAAPVIRRRAPDRSAGEPTTKAMIEAMTEPAVVRLRAVAKRWDSPAHVPRQPSIPAYEVAPDYEVEAAPPWRRRVA